MVTERQREFIANLGVHHCMKEMERLLEDCTTAEAAARIRPLLAEIRGLVARVAAAFPPPES
jgi:hypothetical protein